MASRLVAKSCLHFTPKEPIFLLKPLACTGRNYFTYVNEPAHPIPNKVPKVVSAAEAVSVVKSGELELTFPCVPLFRAQFTSLSAQVCVFYFVCFQCYFGLFMLFL